MVDIVLGGDAPFLADVKRSAGKSILAVNVYSNINNMADLMLEADLAFGAGGTTSWERCCLGLPSIVVSLANNQDDITRVLAAVNAIHFLGNKKQVNSDMIAEYVMHLKSQPSLLNDMSNCAKTVCDGRGCDRVVEAFNEVLNQ